MEQEFRKLLLQLEKYLHLKTSKNRQAERLHKTKLIKQLLLIQKYQQNFQMFQKRKVLIVHLLQTSLLIRLQELPEIPQTILQIKQVYLILHQTNSLQKPEMVTRCLISLDTDKPRNLVCTDLVDMEESSGSRSYRNQLNRNYWKESLRFQTQINSQLKISRIVNLEQKIIRLEIIAGQIQMMGIRTHYALDRIAGILI